MNTCSDCKNDLVCHDQGECLRPTPETPDYGEPWALDSSDSFWNKVVDAAGKTVAGVVPTRRAVTCVNALAGVPDPAAHLANLNATIEQQAETLQSAIELIRRVSTGPATPNDAWQWLKQRGLDEYQHINPDKEPHDQHA